MRSLKSTIWAMRLNFKELKGYLDDAYISRDTGSELTEDRPDPLMVAKPYRDEYIALVCALFGYGNANAIVHFLETLDFSLLDGDEREIYEAFRDHYYRFQSADDVAALFIALSRLKRQSSLEAIFMQGYKKNRSVIDGLDVMIKSIRSAYAYQSRGYDHLLLKPPLSHPSPPPYKRYMMFLRWMVRSDKLDMGLWRGVRRSDLIMPLDTHTFAVSHRLGLLRRKSCDLKAALELTETLKGFDPDDPVKYDFALYRIGQEDRYQDTAM